MQNDNGKTKNILLIIIIILLIALLGMGFMILTKNNKSGGNSSTSTNTPIGMEEGQGEYEVPEMANFVSRNVTLPGWGAFNIPANKATITEGFEFHNPEANLWKEVDIGYGNKLLENLIVGSEVKVSAEHYAKLAGLKGDSYKIKSYNEKYFRVETFDGMDCLSSIKDFEGKEIIVIEIDGKDYEFSAECRENLYYMTFALYLKDGDELLYQSGLVAPGNYVQKMEMTRGLKEGSYDAYVLIQPYRSDKTTPTNNGKVVITLNTW